MSRLRRYRVLAAEIETTSGTAETLAQGDVLYGAYDIQFQANIPFVQLPSSGSMSQEKGTLDARAGTITFKIDVRTKDDGGIPQWASVLLPACGMVAAAQVYKPKTETPGTNVKTLTMGVYQDRKRKQLHGAAGNVKFNFKTGSKIVMEFTFTGVYSSVTDQTMLTSAARYGTAVRWASSTFTIGGSSPACIDTLTFDLGNTVYLRPCPTASNSTGLAGAVITDRRIIGTMDPEARLVATEDVFGLWLAGTEQAFSLTVSSDNDVITFAAPKIQRTNVQEADRSGLEVDQIEFQCNRDAVAGDDEFSITFADIP